MLVTVAEVVLAELPCRVAEALHDGGDGSVGPLPAFLGSGQADLCHASAHRHVAADERGPAGGAALLPVVVGERHAFSRNAVDVRRPVAHHAAVVVADVPSTDVIAPNNEDIRWFPSRLSHYRPTRGQHETQREKHQQYPSHSAPFSLCRL